MTDTSGWHTASWVLGISTVVFIIITVIMFFVITSQGTMIVMGLGCTLLLLTWGGVAAYSYSLSNSPMSRLMSGQMTQGIGKIIGDFNPVKADRW